MGIRRTTMWATSALCTLALCMSGLWPAQATGTASVSGTLSAPDGQPVMGEFGNISVYEQTADGFTLHTNAFPDEFGKWTADLPPGTYRFGGSGMGFAGRYYVAATTLDDATDVDVAGTPVGGIDITLGALPTLSGSVSGSSGALADAEVEIYSQGQFLQQRTDRPTPGSTPSTDWFAYQSAYTAEDGTFSASVPPGTYLVRAGKKGYAARWVGGDTQTSATRFTVTTGDTAVGNIALSPRTSAWGKVAGEKLGYCTANEAEPNAEVPIGFDLSFYGQSFSTAFINGNGTLTFGQPQYSSYPTDMSSTFIPTIAPFFAMIDTSAPGSGEVTYGTSPNGKTLCVLWDGVGYSYNNDDKLNTFQLLLTDRSGQTGRSAGDFDITFNYDDIQWDTTNQGPSSPRAANFSSGVGAVVGYTGGNALPGTFLTLDGSLDQDAFLNAGPNALTAGSANSTQPGRYIFKIANALDLDFGSAVGKVTDEDDAAVAGAWVSVCLRESVFCQYSTTGDDGVFKFASLPAGTYDLSVLPPGGLSLNAGYAEFGVLKDADTAIPTIKLSGPKPPPAGVEITNVGENEAGEPLVYWNEDITLRTKACAGGTATYRMTQGETVLRSGPMTEGPAGVYSATMEKLFPAHGGATITYTIDCPGGGKDGADFNVYIDPSGTVVDQYGPIIGATVTLKRSDTEGGTYTVVPDGDAIMSPGNRTNPDLTSDIGYFGWDVIPGWYTVTAQKAGCTTASTAELPVPPPQLNLTIELDCPAPKPTITPRISGQAQVGKTLTLEPGVWPTGIAVVKAQWLRNGAPISGANGETHAVTAADAGTSVSVELTLQRPGFDSFTTKTASVSVPGTPAPPQPPSDRKAQSVSGAVPKKVAAKKSASLPKTTTGGQKITWKTLTKKTCKVSKGKVKGLKKGRCKLQASAPETSAFLPLAQTFSLKVKR